MTPRESRTVTGVVTIATCTLIWPLGACCTGTPGLGGSGPVGACPSSVLAVPSAARRSHTARHPGCLIAFIPSVPRRGSVRSLPDDCTPFDATLREDVAAHRPEFLQSKVVFSGE